MGSNIDLSKKIRTVPNFPKPGILFRDITTLLKDVEAFRYVVDTLTERYRDKNIDVIVAIEARGFIIGAPVAYNLGVAFVPIRKKEKLPSQTISASYDLEYGSETVEMHSDAVKLGQKVVIIDDLLATGGTAKAGAELVEKLGATRNSQGVFDKLKELGVEFVGQIPSVLTSDLMKVKGIGEATAEKFKSNSIEYYEE